MNQVRLLYGTTYPEQNFFSSDLLWRTRFGVYDPFFLVEFEGQETVLLASDLEYERAKKEAKGCKIERLAEFYPENARTETDALIGFLKSNKITNVVIPSAMPAGIYHQLTGYGFEVKISENPVWYPSREIKTEEEIGYIEEVQKKLEVVLGKVVRILKEATIAGDGTLRGKRGKTLTSEGIRDFMELEFFKLGCLSTTTIVACGDQAVDPHCEGSGPLLANLPIVIDIYPRSKRNWYWADMTRTFFKGAPTFATQNLYRMVLEAQTMAIRMIRHEVNGQDIHKAVVSAFELNSYPTGIKDGTIQGFMHGVGHGVGLDLHEYPVISGEDWLLHAGSVVTVEPGLYYLGIGGVRIEDMVLVEENGVRNLTAFPKELQKMIIP